MSMAKASSSVRRDQQLLRIAVISFRAPVAETGAGNDG
jgi:hypothetical protein